MRRPARGVGLTAAASALAVTVAVAVVGGAGAATVAAGAVLPSAAGAVPTSASGGLAVRADRAALPGPPTVAQCQQKYQIRCYTPLILARAYGLAGAFQEGATGRGETIAVVDSFGSPTIRADLAHFDKAFGIPSPPAFSIIAPAGKIPAYDNSDDRQGWAGETTLDIEYAHAFAPQAKLLLVETPVSETEGVHGFPQIVRAENYVIDHGLADVISQSFGATEQTFTSYAQLAPLRSAFVNAKKHHVTVLAASGDDGAADVGLDETTYYPYPVTSWPPSDPLVTAVGGTQLTLNQQGTRLAPDKVWNDGYGAGGGGKSIFFARPAFQDGVRGVVGTARGVPDISMTAAVDGGALVYATYDPYDPEQDGWSVTGGTSEATPIFAGVVADAATLAGHRLGDINPALYAIRSGHGGITDITVGDNTDEGVTGFAALPGYDLASGLGTVAVAPFVRALARAAG